MSLIEIIGLSQRFGERTVLRDIDLSIDRGEIFAIIGPTGSGKTTLLRLIDLIDKPASGKIVYDGVDLSPGDKARLGARRRMGFVLQKPVVFNMSVFDNIACGLKWRNEEKSSLRRKVDGVLEQMSLTDYRGRNARTLSGGETQMVAIARAIVSQPELLLLDEPTANLDPTLAARVEALIGEIIHQNNTTIIMATHDMAQGQRLADRVGVMLNGEILQSGSWLEVFGSPRSRAVASFVGVENIIDGKIVSSQENMVAIEAGEHIIEAISEYPVGQEVSACIRPEDITLARTKLSSSARNSFTGQISRMITFGALTRVEIDCGFPLVVLITRRSAEEMGLARGKPVHASFKATGVHVIKRQDDGQPLN